MMFKSELGYSYISENIIPLSPCNIRSHSSNMLKIWFDNVTSICTIIYPIVLIELFFIRKKRKSTNTLKHNINISSTPVSSLALCMKINNFQDHLHLAKHLSSLFFQRILSIYHAQGVLVRSR